MQILANALPGFRDMRAPLTAGYLWLLLAWLIRRPDVLSRPSHPVGAAVFDLAVLVGPLWIGIAVGTLAYIVGSVGQALAELLRSNSRRVGSLNPSDSQLAQTISELARFSRGDSLHGLTGASVKIHQRYESMMTAIQAADPSHVSRSQGLYVPDKPIDSHIQDLKTRAMRSTLEALDRALREPDLPATVLVGEQPALFAEVDRLRSEGDLRLALAPPLIGLIGFATWTTSWAWVLAVAPLGVLTYQGVWRVRQSRELIASAIALGRIPSPADTEHAAQIEAITDELQRLEQTHGLTEQVDRRPPGKGTPTQRST